MIIFNGIEFSIGWRADIRFFLVLNFLIDLL